MMLGLAVKMLRNTYREHALVGSHIELIQEGLRQLESRFQRLVIRLVFRGVFQQILERIKIFRLIVREEEEDIVHRKYKWQY